MKREEAIAILDLSKLTAVSGRKYDEAVDMAIEALSAESEQGWIPLNHDGGGATDFPNGYDGQWVIVTDGENISVERIKKDANDHFFPNGRWFELEQVIAWKPLPEPYEGRGKR